MYSFLHSVNVCGNALQIQFQICPYVCADPKVMTPCYTVQPTKNAHNLCFVVLWFVLLCFVVVGFGRFLLISFKFASLVPDNHKITSATLQQIWQYWVNWPHQSFNARCYSQHRTNQNKIMCISYQSVHLSYHGKIGKTNWTNHNSYPSENSYLYSYNVYIVNHWYSFLKAFLNLGQQCQILLSKTE